MALAKPPETQPRRDIDQEILDFWIKKKEIKPRIAKEAKDAYGYFQQAAPGKTFSSATRTEGSLLNDWLFEKGYKSASVQKLLTWLGSSCNYALRYPTLFPSLKGNPFSMVFTPKDDEVPRNIFDDNEMRLVLSDLPNWPKEQALLWVLLASTGMRLSEPFQIHGEEQIDGHRVVFMGTKTESSKRRIVLPKCAEQYLPERIDGGLFTTTPKYAGKEVLRRVRNLGINDPTKVLHSLRHRAETRLGNIPDVKEKVIDAILGHAHDDLEGNQGRRNQRGRRTSSRYFHGNTPDQIAKAINQIGLC